MIGISIIVPIFNVEKYLRKCLNSLVNQTMENIEIILVNDASPDSSDKIMAEYEKQYKNIRCIYLNENQCLGGARNEGITVAQGRYLTFVDSDDYIELDYCEKLYEAALNNDADMVYSVLKMVNEAGDIIGERNTYPKDFSGSIDKNKRKGFINKGTYPCGKLFKKSVWQENKIEFPRHLKYEDAPTIPLFLMYASSCVFVNNTAYYYLKRSDSILSSKNPVYYGDAQKTALLYEKRMEERGFYLQFKEEIEHFITERYYSIYLKRCLAINDTSLLEHTTHAKEMLYKMYPDFWSNKYISSFVVEDIMRMKINDMGGMAALHWENTYKNTIKNDIEFCSEIIKEFYMKNKEKLIALKEVKEKVSMYFYGNEAKKLALSKVFDELAIPYEKDINKINENTVIVLVNPGVEAAAGGRFTCHVLLNMEDYLNGYFDYATKEKRGKFSDQAGH